MPSENNAALIAQLNKIQEMLHTAISLAAGEKQEVGRRSANHKRSVASHSAGPDFSMPARPFFNNYARDLSGPQKFALVVAYLSRGDAAQAVSIDEIEACWNKNTSSLGAFNYAHPTRAKDRDLVDSPKKGTYQLRPRWHTIFP